MKFNPDNPLAMTAGEDSRANRVLNDYAMMGVARSFRGLVARYRSERDAVAKYKANPAGWGNKPIPVMPPSVRMTSFSTWSKRYGWQERVDAFDELERQRERKVFEQDRIEMKRKRVDLLKAVFYKTVQATEKLKPEDADWNDVANALRTIGSELRVELGDEGVLGNESGNRKISTIVIEMPK